MKASKLIEILSQYDGDVDVNFFLIPNDGSEEDGDQNDKALKLVGEICTSELDSENPSVDIGLQEL